MAPQREWFEKDYYRILGVAESATAKEIKSAYRKLSRQYHPDNNPGDAASENRFKEISAAYDVVGDAARRKEYDEVRRLGPAASGFPGGGGVPPGASGSVTPATSATSWAACSGAAAVAAAAAGAVAPTEARTSRPSSTSPSRTPSPA